jgi:MFS superfamily sulfate permease-like transporter
MLALAFALTLALGVEIGLVAAVAVSLGVLGVAGLRSRVVDTSGDLPASVAVVCIDGPLTFANHRGLRQALARIVKDRGPDTLRAVVVDLSKTTYADVSADRALDDLVDDYADGGITVHLAAPNARVLRLLEGSGLWAKLGPTAHRDLAGARSAARAEGIDATQGRGT